ncbi:hypothetical protein AB1K54_05345 [Microbacterium sp. BWT-B31]|uniref:hypothetical protein n=1 Tax=Microbacterium sp. BWT-B31 TaxID=3232072 RepID=UPI00352955D6
MNARIRALGAARWIRQAVAAATAIALVAIGEPVASAAAPAPDDGAVTWSVRPAGPMGADGRSWVESTLDPGSTSHEYLEVRNLGRQDAEFVLQAADGYFTDTGRFNILPRSEASVGAGSWISLPESAHVPAGTAAVVPFTIHVPENASPGDHPAGVAAGIAAEGSGSGANVVGVDSRIGFRVMIRVAGELTPSLAVEALGDYHGSLNPFQPGSVTVRYTVRNTGNTRLGIGLTGQSAAASGAARRVNPGTVRELAPGDVRTGAFVLDDVWPTGLVGVSVAVDAATIPGSDVSVPTARTEVLVTAIPWTQLTLGLLVALLVMLVVRRLGAGRRARGRQLRRGPSYAGGDELSAEE